MTHISFRIFFILAFLLQGWNVFAQKLIGNPKLNDGLYVIVGDISVEGNKKTKPSIITRELMFDSGDTILQSAFDSIMIRSKQNIQNTNLFLFVALDTLTTLNKLDVKISVQERWYTWPNPHLEFADRNFNVWYETRDFKRLTYGLFFYQENFRGRNEKIFLVVKLGYTQQVGFGYTVPYINKRKKSGFSLNAARSRWHEVMLTSIDNELIFHRENNRFVRHEWNVGGSYVYRPRYANSHTFSVEYKANEVVDSVAILNPNYFLKGKMAQNYLRFSYKFKRDRRDITAYPLHGHYFDLEVVPTFIDMTADSRNLIWCLSSFKQFFELRKRVYFAYSLRGKVSGNALQPYFNTRGFGFGNEYPRSYEYYVVNGQHYALLRSNFKYNLLPTKYLKIKQVPWSKFNTIPIALYMNFIYDMGYVWDKQYYKPNPLNNELLIGYGVGLDYVTYYQVVVRGEYTFTKRGEHAFFLHMTLPI